MQREYLGGFKGIRRSSVTIDNIKTRSSYAQGKGCYSPSINKSKEFKRKVEKEISKSEIEQILA